MDDETSTSPEDQQGTGGGDGGTAEPKKADDKPESTTKADGRPDGKKDDEQGRKDQFATVAGDPLADFLGIPERIAVYREIIASGDVERFALRLANHPDEISAVTEIIREDQLTSRQDTIDFIKHMVDSGVVERWEVSDQVREALEWLKDATARVVTDKNHRTVEIDPPVRRRRRGRGESVEEGATSEQSPDVIIIPAETVPPKQGTDSESSANTDGTES